MVVVLVDQDVTVDLDVLKYVVVDLDVDLLVCQVVVV